MPDPPSTRTCSLSGMHDPGPVICSQCCVPATSFVRVQKRSEKARSNSGLVPSYELVFRRILGNKSEKGSEGLEEHSGAHANPLSRR